MTGRVAGCGAGREWEKMLRLIKLSGVAEGEGLRNKSVRHLRGFLTSFLPTLDQENPPDLQA